MLKPEYLASEAVNNLSPEEYAIIVNKSTEQAFTGQYWDTTEDGLYQCKVCSSVLFDSAHKYDSHCGWPSYYDAIGDTIETETDYNLGYARTEIHCKKCGAHLGHVFDDGPQAATGLRYCVNSASISKKNKI